MEKINIDNRVEKELQDELKSLGKEVSKSAFFDKKEDGTRGVNLGNVNAFLEAIKDQSWSEIKDQKQDKLWMTAVQIKLLSLGYDLGSKGVDGWFGPATKAAVEKFQIANGLDKDGFPGAETIKKLLDPNAKKASEATKGSGVENIDNNKKSNDFEQALKSESVLNTIFMNLLPWDQLHFKSGMKQLETDNYSYQVVGGIVKRTNKPSNSVQIKKSEYFQKGEWRENIEVNNKKKSSDSPEKKSEAVLMQESFQKIPDLNNVYSNLPQWEQNNFKIGIKTLQTNEYNYQIKNNILTRTSKPKNMIELTQQEHFKNGKREKIITKQKIDAKPEIFQINRFLELGEEEKNIYNALQSREKAQFSNGRLEIKTSKYNYKVVNQQLTRKSIPSYMIELPKSEVLKNNKWEKIS